MHQVFVSYQRDSKNIADDIVKMLEANKIKCWYAPRDVEGSYAQSIVSAINKAKVFVLVLDAKASNSHHVLNEVETAYEAMDSEDFAIIPYRISDEPLSDAMNYYIKRFHWVDAANQPLKNAFADLLCKVKNKLGVKDTKKYDAIREQNKYFVYDDEFELQRLSSQRGLLEKSIEHVYLETNEQYEEPVVLDIGSNDGYLTDQLKEKLGAKLTLGLEYDAQAVKSANEKFGGQDMFFYECDLEADDLRDKLTALLKEHEITHVDIIHISMVLLHLEYPFKVLRTLRRFIRRGGKLIIRDIDDGFTLAYPDEDGLFSESIAMVKRNPRWGYRHSGREIYTLMKKLNFEQIKLENIGINTIDMSFQDREALYLTYFGAILQDIEFLLERDPTNEVYINDRNWLIEHSNEMEKQFYQKSFFFILGFVIYTGIAE